jgi:drug/metabolite transporter (DMT)-like permease
MGYIFVILAATFWGSLGTVVTYLKDAGFNSYEISFFRLFFATILMFIYILFSDRKKFKISGKKLIFCLLVGVISQGLFNLFYFGSIVRVGITTGVILLYTAPIFTMLFARIFNGTILTKTNIISIVLCFTGCFFIVTNGSINNFVGDTIGIILGILAAMSYGILPIFNKNLPKGIDPYTLIFYSFLAGVLVISPQINPLESLETLFQDKSMIILGLGFGFVPTILSHLFFLKAIKYLDPVRVSIIANFEVMVASCMGFFIYGEELGIIKIIGMILIIIASTLPSIRRKRSIVV